MPQPSGSAPRAGREAAKVAALLIASLAFALAAAEIGLAVTDQLGPWPELYPGDRSPTSLAGQVDSVTGWRMRPGSAIRSREGAEFTVTYAADSFGFRRSTGPEPADAPHRIVFIGDSFTFGNAVEYEEAFATRVARALADTRSYNLGMSGFGIDQMWLSLRHYGRARRPAIVVLTFVDDDLRRSLSAYRRRGGGWWPKPTFVLEGDSLVPMQRPGPVRGWIVRHSRLYEAWRRLNWRATTEYAAGGPWELNAALLRAIRDDCRAMGADLLVVRLPEKGAWRPAKAMGDALARDSIAFLDMAALLPADPRALYFQRDPHLRPLGHAWVADAIASDFVARGWARAASSSSTPSHP